MKTRTTQDHEFSVNVPPFFDNYLGRKTSTKRVVKIANSKEEALAKLRKQYPNNDVSYVGILHAPVEQPRQHKRRFNR